MSSTSNAGKNRWDLAITNFSEGSVAYLLDLPIGYKPDIHDARRWDVVNKLAETIGDEKRISEQSLSLRCFLLVMILPEEDLTSLERIRTYVGGRLPQKTGDKLVDELIRLVFNGLSMEFMPGIEQDRIAVSAAFQDPKLCTPVAQAFLDDVDLVTLFPGAEREPDERGRITASSLLTWLPAGGGTTDLSILIGNLVEQTLARMRFRATLTEDHIEEFVRESLDQSRRLARGEEVDILVLTGLVGIQTVEALDHGTWGIKPAQGLAISEIPPRDSPRAKSVLWMKVPHRVVDRCPAGIDEQQAMNVFDNLAKLSKTFHASLTRKTRTLRFGLLAWAVDQDQDRGINVQSTASWSLLPIMSSQPPWVDDHSRNSSTTNMNFSDLAAVADIVDELGEVTPKLDISLGRILRVASERRDPVDALIDAVIAWENMLGSRSDSTFKVCAAMSWLLEPEVEEQRKSLFKKAKKIYNLRSRVVHGDEDADALVAGEDASDALRLAINLFRRIHSHESLAAMRSGARSEAILLGSQQY